MASERVARRLTAVLAADVAGYSRLVGNDEEGTLAQWKAHWHALLEPSIKEYRGRIVRVIGDGLLVEFASVVDAVRCAVDIQRGMAARNVDVPLAVFRPHLYRFDLIGDCPALSRGGLGHMSDTELLLKPKAAEQAGAVRRVEVFTGAGRRRRWSPEQKALIVSETYQAGETVSAVARRHGLTPQQLFTWRREAQRAPIGESGMAFAPVVLETSGSRAGVPIAPTRCGSSPWAEIVIGAVTVRVPPGIELATLLLILRAVTTALA